MESKQVIVFRKDLLKGEHGIRKGKFAGQVAHASLCALLARFEKERTMSASGAPATRYSATFEDGSILDNWLNGIYTKVVVGVDDEDELMTLVEQLESIKGEGTDIPYALITDCGKTEFGGIPTVTCLGIGPADSVVLDRITGHLKLL